MGLLDWLKGGKQAEGSGAGTSETERVEARREAQDPVVPEGGQPGTTDPALERRDEEAGRHSGI